MVYVLKTTLNLHYLHIENSLNYNKAGIVAIPVVQTPPNTHLQHYSSGHNLSVVLIKAINVFFEIAAETPIPTPFTGYKTTHFFHKSTSMHGVVACMCTKRCVTKKRK